MSISVSNNPSALLALQTLNKTTDQLNQTQNEISTQLAVAAPKDNATVWANAQSQRSEVDSLGAVTSGLNRATSISDVTLTAGQTVLNLLNEMKQQALSASDSQLDSTSRGAFNSDFAGVLAQVTTTINSADFDGTNLLNGSQATGLRFITTADASQTVTLPTANLSLGGSVITVGSTASLPTAAAASAMVAQISASIANLTDFMTSVGNQASLVTSHAQLVSNLSTVLTNGIQDLTATDDAADSARLKALQIQQQLSQQSLSIANSAPAILLTLFR
jgi:flagellin